MPDKRSENSASVRAFAAKPVVIRSFAWAVIFAAVGLILRPNIVFNDIVNGTVHALTLVFIAMALLFGFAMAELTDPIYARTERPSSIEATEYILRNSERVVGRWGVAGDGSASFDLYDKNGARRVEAFAGGLILWDGEEKIRAFLSLGENGPSLVLLGGKGAAGGSFARLESTSDGAKLSLASLGIEMGNLEATDDGPVLTFKDVNGKETVQANTLAGGYLELAGTGGNTSVELSGLVPSIEIKDSDGEVVWKAPTSV